MNSANLKKSFIWNTLGSSFNAFNSLFFLIIVTRINGLDNAGIFTLCYATACMLYIIGTYTGRTYQVTENDKDISDNEYIINRLITVIFMIIIGVVFGLFNNYNSLKLLSLILLCIYKGIEAISDIFYGILQKNDRLDLVGKSLFIRSLLNLVSFIIIDIVSNNIMFSILALILTNILVLIFYDIRNSTKYIKKQSKINFIGVYKILTCGFFTFAFTLIANYLINIPRYAIDFYLDESYQTIFGIIIMPGTFITLLSQFIIQPLIIKLKNSYQNKNKILFNKIVKKILLFIIVIGLITITGAYFVGIPILNFLYDIDMNSYLYALIIILIGTTFYALVTLLSNCLVIFRKTKIQFIAYLFVAIIGAICSKKMVNTYGFNGGIYSYILIMLVLFLVYGIIYLIINNKKGTWNIMSKKKKNYIDNAFINVYSLLQKKSLGKIKSIMYYLDLIMCIFIKKAKYACNKKKKVAIIYNLALGDGIVFCSAIQNIRNIYPNNKYELHIYCQKGLGIIYKNMDIFDNICELDFNKATINLKTRFNNIKTIRKIYYDLVLDPVGANECFTNVLTSKITLSKRKIGCIISDSEIKCPNNILKNTYSEIKNIHSSSLIEQYYEFFYDKYNIKYYSFNKKIDTKKMPKKYYTLFPSASTNLKKWPIERYAEIVKKIYNKTGLPLLLCGTERDRDDYNKLISLIGDIPYVDIIGKTNILEFIEVIKNSKFVITNDTSTYHIAVTNEVPVAIITGGYTYDRYVKYDFKGNEKYKKPYIIVNEMKCFNCDNRCQKLTNSDKIWPCLNDVSVEYAFKIIEKMIDTEYGGEHNENK